ncbi:MAG: bifunctional DNA-formamidopyrimidine glycosylase/DNA-(apurinic or apyrimidinic site) lyase [Actinomycetota bacterium]
MPELPEVETIRAGLEPHLVGRTFNRVEIADGRLTRPHDPVETAAELTGESVEALERRGKYLIVRFVSGRVLLIHLRMTGSLLLVRERDAIDDPYRRAVIRLDNGSDVVYRDVRRFGTWLLFEPGELEPYLDERVGVEPLSRSLTARSLTDRIARRRSPVKALLLDQRLFAGIGNIYADEALWWARLHPLRPGHDVSHEQLAALVHSVRRALRLAIARQGATLRDYRSADGARGSMQAEFRVYGREGEPCPRCGHAIEKTRVAGRGTWYCPSCQF